MYLLRFILLLIGVAFCNHIQAATISSLPTGGNWNQPTTWVGGMVPQSTDDVVINGPVSLTGLVTEIRNLNVTASGNIRTFFINDGSLYGLTINGDFTNEGQIQSVNTNRIEIEFKGLNFNNSGTFNIYELALNSAAMVFSGTDKIDVERLTLQQPGLISGQIEFDNRFLTTNGHTINVDSQSDLLFHNLVNATISGTAQRVETVDRVANLTWLQGILYAAGEVRTDLTTQTLNCESICRVYSGRHNIDRLQLSAAMESVSSVSDPVILKGDLGIESTGFLRPFFLNDGGTYATVIEGNFINYGQVRSTNSNKLQIEVQGDFSNQGLYLVDNTYVGWPATANASNYEIEFSQTYAVWQPVVITTDTKYLINDKTDQNWYWRYRTALNDGSYTDWSRVRFINNPTGHAADPPAITLVEDETTWPSGDNPTVTVSILSTAELTRQTLFYNCAAGVCQADLVPTANPNQYHYTINATTNLALDATTLEYWLEAENEYGVTGTLGNSSAPQVLEKLSSGGGGSDPAPPERPTSVRALYCENNVYFNFLPSARSHRYEVFAGDEALNLSSTFTLNASELNTETNGRLSGVKQWRSAPALMAIKAYDVRNQASSLSEIITLQKRSNCDDALTVELKKELLADSRVKLEWHYNYFLLADNQPQVYPTPGSTFNLQLQDAEANIKSSLNHRSNAQWNSGEGKFVQFVYPQDYRGLTLKSSLQANLLQDIGAALQDILTHVFAGPKNTVKISLENGRGTEILSTNKQIVEDQKYSYEVVNSLSPQTGCKYDLTDSNQWCAFFITLKNTGNINWNLEEGDWAWHKFGSNNLDLWDLNEITTFGDLGEELTLVAYYKGDYQDLKNDELGVRLKRENEFLYGEKITLTLTPKVVEQRAFKTSIKDVVIYESQSEAATKVDTITDLNSNVVVLDKAEKGDYVDKYKTDRWYKVRYQEVEGWVVATVIRPEWIELGQYGPEYCNWSRPKGIKLQHIALHSTAGVGSAKSVADDIVTSVPIQKDCLTAHFFTDRNGKTVQLRNVWVRLSHVGYKSPWHTQVEGWHNINSIGIELINTGANQEVSKEVFPITKDLFALNWKAWEDSWVWGGDSKRRKRWELYPDQQYQELDRLLVYLEESTGIPYEFFADDDYRSNKLSYFPKEGSGHASADITVRKIVLDYYKALNNFKGVVSHHNITGKWDTGPAFDQQHFNLQSQSK